MRPALIASIALSFTAGAGLVPATAAPATSAPAAISVATAATNTAPLITVNQNKTGAQSAYNCGPSSVVIALKSVGKNPKGYSTSQRAAVEKVRANIGHSGPTDLSKLEAEIKTYGVKTTRVKYAAGVTAASKGKTVILHTNLYGGHYVVAKGQDSAGKIRVSDPAGGKIYYKTAKQLNDIKRSFDRATIVG